MTSLIINLTKNSLYPMHLKISQFSQKSILVFEPEIKPSLAVIVEIKKIAARIAISIISDRYVPPRILATDHHTDSSDRHFYAPLR